VVQFVPVGAALPLLAGHEKQKSLKTRRFSVFFQEILGSGY